MTGPLWGTPHLLTLSRVPLTCRHHGDPGSGAVTTAHTHPPPLPSDPAHAAEAAAMPDVTARPIARTPKLQTVPQLLSAAAVGRKMTAAGPA
ncbi:hypothetical protein MRX96_048411 [Rhipicephalus microplus]